MAATNTIAAGIMDAMMFAFMGPGSFGCPHVACTWPLISASPPPAALGCSMALVCDENLFWPGAQLQCRFRDWLRLWPVLALFRIWATFWSGPRPEWRGVSAAPLPIPCQPVSVLCDCLQPHSSFPTIPAPIMHSLPSCTINQTIRSEPFTHLSSSIDHHLSRID